MNKDLILKSVNHKDLKNEQQYLIGTYDERHDNYEFGFAIYKNKKWIFNDALDTIVNGKDIVFEYPIRKIHTPINLSQHNNWKTYKEWNDLDFYIVEGEKATLIDNKLKFSNNQVKQKASTDDFDEFIQEELSYYGEI